MLLLVTGSRDWTDEQAIHRTFAEHTGFEHNVTLISGHCPTGADYYAERYAKTRGWDIELHPARWGLDPKREYDTIISMRNDLVGQIFGDTLTVKGISPNKSSDGSVLYELECEVCGGLNERTVSDLRRGRTNCLATCRDLIAKNSPLKTIYGGYLRGARGRGLDFGLSVEDFESIIRKNCHYCDIEPQNYMKKSGSREGLKYNGIDRVDNKMGYQLSNCVPCCKFCNFAKSRWGVDDFSKWLEHVKGYGRAAGPIRNQQMVDRKPDLVLAFILNGSKGASGTVRMARKAGLRVHVVEATTGP